MPRFVILEHDHPFRHWDFFLEAGDVLKAWRLLAEPERGRPIPAERLPDHRLIYLDYEGPVAANRGRVTRWDGGTFGWHEKTADEPMVAVTGRTVRGLVTLQRKLGGWLWTWF